MCFQDHVELDEEFRENNLGLLERFYKLFDSILKVCCAHVHVIMGW